MEQLSLFDDRKTTAPLASRLRPDSLEGFIGQEHLLGKGKLLRQLIDNDNISSMIFWGPPGVGKTTLANIIAKKTHASFINFSAVTSGIKEIKEVMAQAENSRAMGMRTVLFVDEIHRFNKAQQDAFLPFVEKGRNPQGFGSVHINISVDLLAAIAVFSNGDARTALNTLEMAITNGETGPGEITVTKEILEQCISKKSLLYDKNGEEHYNLISALHKSMRNSDPDAAIYWLARMLESGEDPLYVARRLIRFASEDVGMADSQALTVAVSAYQACHFIGMPECNVTLAHAVTYLSMAPKSNALYIAYGECREDAMHMLAEPVPLQLRNAPTKLMEDLHYGEGYEYAHDTSEKLTRMTCLPQNLSGRHYYRPTSQGAEAYVKDRLEAIEKWKCEGTQKGE